MHLGKNTWMVFVAMSVLLAACTQGTAEPDECLDDLGKADDLNQVAPDWLQVEATCEWSCGEMDAQDPLAEGVTYDQDEDVLRTETNLALGPLSECRRNRADRDPEAVCVWNVPSECWSMRLAVGPDPAGAQVEFSAYAGDMDSDGASSLPLDYLKGTLPWRFEMSPDNASFVWGQVKASFLLKTCCKICSRGKACGDTCIEYRDICRLPSGCACDVAA